MDDKSLSILKHRFFPSFYKNEAPRLIEFMRYYLEWLQGEEQAYWIVNNLKDFTDIDGSIDNYIEHLKNELMIDFPVTYAGDLRYIMKHLVMLYQSKGTLASYKFFFRAMYDSFCDIYYPREEIIKASDGRWIQGYYCYCSAIPLTDLIKLNGHTVTEVETGLVGLISDLRPYYFLGESEIKYCLIITDTRKPFTQGNHFTIEDYEGTFTLEQTEYSDGYWEGTYGFLDSDKVLQDSFYYQNFSYEITSLVPFDDYKDIVQKLIHPAGMKLFGRYQLADSANPIGCPSDGSLRTSFLHWWILKMFMVVYATMKSMWRHWYLKWIPETYQYPFTADQQYKYKDYGKVENVRDYTPNDLLKLTNKSSKLLFTRSGLLQNDVYWEDYLLADELNTYNVAAIYAAEPLVQTTYIGADKNLLTVKDKPVADEIFVFVDGKKIRKNRISQGDGTLSISYIDPSDITEGRVSIYSLKKDILKFYYARNIEHTEEGLVFDDGLIIHKNLTFKPDDSSLDEDPLFITDKTEYQKSHPEKIQIEHTKLCGYAKEQFVIFLDGLLVYDTVEYDTEHGILTLPKEGYCEIYIFRNEQDLSVHTYFDYLIRDNGRHLCSVLPLRNLRYRNEEQFDYWYKKYRAFTTPYNADQQNYNKLFSNITLYEDLTGTDLMTPTNSSCKLCFHDGKQFAPDWINYTTSFETNTDNIIASLESVYPHIHATAVAGTIDLHEYWDSDLEETFAQLTKPYKLFVFVDGQKIRNDLITCEGNQILLANKDTGDVDIYFIDPKCFYDIATITCTPTKEMYMYRESTGKTKQVIPYHDSVGTYQLQLEKGDRTLYMPFYKGEFIWTSIENGRLTFDFPDGANEYIELYRLIKFDKYSVISYIQTKDFTYSNPNNIMLCYNPVTNIRV